MLAGLRHGYLTRPLALTMDSAYEGESVRTLESDMAVHRVGARLRSRITDASGRARTCAWPPHAVDPGRYFGETGHQLCAASNSRRRAHNHGDVTAKGATGKAWRGSQGLHRCSEGGDGGSALKCDRRTGSRGGEVNGSAAASLSLPDRSAQPRGRCPADVAPRRRPALRWRAGCSARTDWGGGTGRCSR